MSIGPFSFQGLPVWLQDVLIIAGCLILIAAIIGFVRKTWPVLKAFVLTVISLQTLPAFMESTTTTLKAQNATLAAQDDRQVAISNLLDAQDLKIAEIHHETHENNGTSIKDSQHRTELALARVEKGVKGLYDRTAALERTTPRPPNPITPKRRSTK